MPGKKQISMAVNKVPDFNYSQQVGVSNAHLTDVKDWSGCEAKTEQGATELTRHWIYKVYAQG